MEGGRIVVVSRDTSKGRPREGIVRSWYRGCGAKGGHRADRDRRELKGRRRQGQSVPLRPLRYCPCFLAPLISAVQAAESAQSYGSTKGTTSTAMSRMSPSLSGGWTKSSVAKIDTSYAVKETTYHYPLYLPCRDDQDESLVSAKPQTHRQYYAVLTPGRHIASSVLASVGS